MDWLAAATRALQQPVAVSVPFVEEALVDPARPSSLGYAVTLARGQTLTVQVSVATDTPGRVFVDLFEPNTNRLSTSRPVASAPEDQTELSHEAQRSGTYLLRVQPELLRGGHLRVTSTPAPSLQFPVSGGGASNIQSDYGDARDGGRRSHEGVDIFAPRGTPVVASSDGIVTQVGENRLGGRVVWVWNPARGTRVAVGREATALVVAATGRDPGWTGTGPTRPVVLTPTSLTAGVEELAGDGRGSFATPEGFVPLVGRDDQVVAVAQGEVVAVADPTLVWNRYLAEADDAAFALALAGAGPVAFAEAEHGYGESQGLAALPASWVQAGVALLVAALLAMWCAGQRLGPPERTDRDQAPPRTAYLDAMVSALSRTSSDARPVAELHDADRSPHLSGGRRAR
jgi:hypothetical protein